jgi:hypothetical protein
MKPTESFNFWYRWLHGVCLFIIAFGACMIVLPEFTFRLFSIILYSTPDVLLQLESTTQSYIKLIHAIAGAIMISWALSLIFILRYLFKTNDKTGWLAIFAVVTVWYIPDTSLSLLYGFWQNAILNTTLYLMFAIPLAATWRIFYPALARK